MCCVQACCSTPPLPLVLALQNLKCMCMVALCHQQLVACRASSDALLSNQPGAAIAASVFKSLLVCSVQRMITQLGHAACKGDTPLTNGSMSEALVLFYFKKCAFQCPLSAQMASLYCCHATCKQG